MKLESQNPLCLGFKIEKFLDLKNFQVLEISASVPLAKQESCPSDGTRLSTLCTFVGNSGTQKIRFGACRNCGYAGYIDRPTKEWINDFYLHTWDSAGEADVESEIQKAKERLIAGDMSKEKESVLLIKKLGLAKNRAICELGCGYGGSLRQIKDLGFSDLIGVENSSHRAAIAEKAYGIKVLTGAFESENVQNGLKIKAPFGAIFSYHVLEHVYDPNEVVALAAELQKDGDYLILSVPNFVKESSMGVLSFVPHLHSFTAESLRLLLARNGYGVTDVSMTTNQNLNVVGKKGASAGEAKGKDFFSEAIEKFYRGLGLSGRKRAYTRRLWWLGNTDLGGQRCFLGSNIFERLNWKLFRKFSGNEAAKSILVSDLAQRYSSLHDSPLEIQFEGNIRLFYK